MGNIPAEIHLQVSAYVVTDGKIFRRLDPYHSLPSMKHVSTRTLTVRSHIFILDEMRPLNKTVYDEEHESLKKASVSCLLLSAG